MKKYFFVGDIHKSTKVRFPEIILLEQRSKRLKLVTESKTYEIDSSLRRLAKHLPRQKFIRVHKNYLVPLHRIMGFDRKSGHLYVQPFKPDNNIELPETWIRIPIGKKFNRLLCREEIVPGQEKRFKKKLNQLLLHVLNGETDN